MLDLFRFLMRTTPCKRFSVSAIRRTTRVLEFDRCRTPRLECLEPRLLLTNVPAGAVAGTWTEANSPYVLQGNAWVSPGTSLQIQAGVVVQSASGTYNLQYQAGSSGSISTASFTTASLTISESSIAVTGSTFASTVYCAATYVSQLVNNTSFGTVDISGGR